jgi:hypothetical protein
MKSNEFRQQLAQSQMFVSLTTHMDDAEKGRFLNWLQLRGLSPGVGSIIHYLALYEVRQLAKKILVESKASIAVLRERTRDDDRWQQRILVVVCAIAIMLAVQTFLMLRLVS